MSNDKTAEEIEMALDALLIARGEHPTRVRNPLYGEERKLAKDLSAQQLKEYREKLKKVLKAQEQQNGNWLNRDVYDYVIKLIDKTDSTK